MRISDWSSDVCSSDLTTVFVKLFKKSSDELIVGGHSVDVLSVIRDGKVLLTSRTARTFPKDHVEPRIIEIMRSEEHTSELQSLMRISYAVICLTKKTNHTTKQQSNKVETIHTNHTRTTTHTYQTNN